MSFTLFLVLITIVCFLLVVVIMVQNPKGGGLSSTFGGGASMGGGVQRTTDFLDKSTWVLGIILMILVLLSGMAFTGSGVESKLYDESVAPSQNLTTPAVTPESSNTPAKETPQN
ncbi:MAG: preprotein translocase subunit SecG [Bacteroidota bacterium]|nr:preprotein translocase subunit SecG [Bacteroidota bacterium]